MKISPTLCILAALAAGCASVPETSFQLNVKKGTVEVTSPKQTGFTNLTASVETNGTFKINVGSYSSYNDPDVIATVSAANLQMMDRTIQLTDKLLQMMQTMGAKAATSGIAP